MQRLSRFDRYRSLLKPLGFGFAAVLLVLAFVHLGGEVIEGDTRSFDMYLVHGAQALRLGHPWVAAAMRDLSGMGSTTVLAVFTLATVGYLALVSARPLALIMASAVVSGTVAVSLLKAAYGRLRPDAIFAELVASGASFPSGHASISAIVFLTLGALVASTRSRWVERTYILAVAVLMTLLVGVSRIALGVHWGTDVLAGWALGVAWAMLWLLLARRLVRPEAGASDAARAGTE
jgi:undecaprenyl-diphosphatase